MAENKERVILTGDRPTGRLHIGHYVGSLRRRFEIQQTGGFKDMFVFIADLQALTDNTDNPEKVRQNVIEVALDYLSVGLDPDKITIYVQSQIPELAELSFYFMNMVTVARLQRNPTVKNEILLRGFKNADEESGDDNKKGIPVGFFTYPISQAADITLFNATEVPVGEDQKPMLEQTVEIVRRFNSIYGDTLVEPKVVLPTNAACLRLPGTDGKAKMSKSLGNCIYLSDTKEEMHSKIMSMYTDPLHINVSDPGHIEGNTVFIYLDAFCKPDSFAQFWPDFANLDELKEAYMKGGIGDVKCKKFLEKILNEEFEPIRARRKSFEKDIPAVYDMLQNGCAKAEITARETIEKVRKSMRINYFDDKLLIEDQARRYAEGLMG